MVRVLKLILVGLMIATSLQGVTGGTAASPSASAPFLTRSLVEAQMTQAYAAIERAAPGAAAATPWDQVVDTAYGWYTQLVADPAFTETFASLPSPVFTFQTHFAKSGVLEAYYGFDWADAQGSHTTYWTGSFATGALRGPTTSTEPLRQAGIVSNWWSGYQYQISSGTTIGEVSGDQNVPAASRPGDVPQEVPSGYYVDPEISIWIGLTNNDGTSGTGNLLQTGYHTDVAQPSIENGRLWYEFVPDALHEYIGCTSAVPAGDYVYEDIRRADDTHWQLLAEDVSQGWGCTNLYPTGYFDPHYTQAIVETEKYDENGHWDAQQLARFSPSVGLYDFKFADTWGASYTMTSSGATGTDITMSQYCNPYSFGVCWNRYYSTSESLNYNYGGWFGGYGYGLVSWQTSAYDWKVVGNSP
jgi:hypothetical protein